MFQRSGSKMGARLGKTTGWIHRSKMKSKGITMITKVSYQKIDDEGLHYTHKNINEVYQADTIILCTGQLSENSLLQPLKDANISAHLIGGAYEATELDAKKAIDQATRLAIGI